jgi:hypothetical protein
MELQQSAVLFQERRAYLGRGREEELSAFVNVVDSALGERLVKLVAVLTLPDRRERTQLSASALYARSINLDRSATILRPLAKDPSNVNLSAASTARPALTNSSTCPSISASRSLYAAAFSSGWW